AGAGISVVGFEGDLDLRVGYGVGRCRHAHGGMALRLYGEGAAADASSALLGVPHLVIISTPWFGQTPCLQLDLEVVPDAVSPELAAGLRRRAGGSQGQAIGRVGDHSEHPETQKPDP